MTIVDAEFVRFLRLFWRSVQGDCSAGAPVGEVLTDSLRRAQLTVKINPTDDE